MEFEQLRFGPKTYLGVRGVVTFEEMRDSKRYEYALSKTMNYLREKGLTPSGPPVTLYYTWDEANQKTDRGIAIPVEGVTEVEDDELVLMEIEESKVVKAVHVGEYMKLIETHDALTKYLQDNKLEFDKYAIEEYMTDPMSEPDQSKWVTNVYYTIK